MNGQRIYMAGVGGMLGHAFHRKFSPDNVVRCTDKDVNADWLSFLDFRDRAAYQKDVRDFSPDLLFHIGAHTSLEYCEDNIDDAYATNTLPVETAVSLANELNIPLLYISTAGIFDGAQEEYDDWDQPKPLGHYARSKYMGEKLVAQSCARHVVCRAGWMMGGGPDKDKKFIRKILRQIEMGAEELFVVDDKLGTPTYTHDFAANVEAVLDAELWGVFNMVCGGMTGRLEVAEELLKIMSLQDRVKITPVSSEHFAEEYFAARPPSERLVTKRLDLHGINQMRDWRVCLQEYVDECYSHLCG